ncbi:MAG TPA: hypothetical protein VFK47_01755 [Ktedonobacteraceae bacterium]|nr:hypothetical protein [Ktedonobacteraceae bacterium]
MAWLVARENEPLPLLVQVAVPPPVTDPERLMEEVEEQIRWSVPALTTAGRSTATDVLVAGLVQLFAVTVTE